MRTVKDSLFSKFTCLADKCTDTCCTGWEIDIDDESLDRFKEAEGSLKEKLDNAIDYERGIIKYNNKGVCALLRSDGLCSLVCDYGEDILCNICHTYPRHVEEYDGVREWSLALSCPEVVRMVLTAESIDFIVEDNETPEPLFDDFEDFDYMLYSALSDSREVIYKHLKNRKVSILTRISLILDFTAKLQLLVDEGEYFKIQDLIDEFDALNLTENYNSDMHRFLNKTDVFTYINKHINVLYDLERLRISWDDVLDRGKSLLLNVDDFCNSYCYDDKELENLLISLIYTYYVGAVYDDCVYAKAAMCVFIAIMMSYYSCIDGIDKIAAISSLAREVEHSDDNLNALEEYFNQYV